MTGAVGLREMKKERTRAEIVSVATRLFNQRGFENVTVEEIAAEAEVAHRTFYRYFATKEELVLGPMQDKLDAFIEQLRLRPADEPVIASIREVIVILATRYESESGHDRQRSALVRATSSLRQAQDERHAALEGLLVPFIAGRLAVDPTDDIRPAVIAGCAMASIRAATSQWLNGDPERPFLPLVAEALTMFSDAFAHIG